MSDMAMQTRAPASQHAGIRGVAVAIGAVLVGFVLGLGLDVFGLIWPWVLALAITGAGLARGRQSPWVFWLALGVAAGAVAYITLGVLGPDGPSSGSGGSWTRTQ
jgi:hypothetical protein